MQIGYGELTLDTTGLDYPMLAGNLASILISIIVTTVVSLVKPDAKPYDWEGTRNLLMVEEEFTGVPAFHRFEVIRFCCSSLVILPTTGRAFKAHIARYAIQNLLAAVDRRGHEVCHTLRIRLRTLRIRIKPLRHTSNDKHAVECSSVSKKARSDNIAG